MTDVNHRRKNRKPVNRRYPEKAYRNGYAYQDNKRYPEAMAEFRAELEALGHENFTIIGEGASGAPRIGRTDYLDKSMHSWGKKSELADRNTGGSIGNDFTNGHRGMAKAVKGAKKRARSALRFHENAETKKLANEL